MKQYQVIFLDKNLTSKSPLHRGGFDPADIQDKLNEYAAQGWRVLSCTPMSLSNGTTDQFSIVLETDV
jgi:hypothetical protein